MLSIHFCAEACETRRSHLRPGGGVPFEARPLKAGVLLFGLLVGNARVVIEGLELSPGDAHTQDGPPLHATTARCVTLRTEHLLLAVKSFSVLLSYSLHETLQCEGSYPLPLLAQPVGGAVPLATGVDGQRLVLRGTLVLRNHATLWRLAVHMAHHLTLAARPRALQQGGSNWINKGQEEALR